MPMPVAGSKFGTATRIYDNSTKTLLYDQTGWKATWLGADLLYDSISARQRSKTLPRKKYLNTEVHTTYEKVYASITHVGQKKRDKMSRIGETCFRFAVALPNDAAGAMALITIKEHGLRLPRGICGIH